MTSALWILKRNWQWMLTPRRRDVDTVKQFGGGDTKAARDEQNAVKRNVAAPAFDATDVAPIESGNDCELCLGQLQLFSQLLHMHAK